MATTEQQAPVHAPYDPTGEATILENAGQRIKQELQQTMPDDPHGYWNAALDAAAKLLDSDARKIKQGDGGMYYRALDGQNMPA